MTIKDSLIDDFSYFRLHRREAVWILSRLPNIRVGRGDGAPYSDQDITEALNMFSFVSAENKFVLENLRDQANLQLIPEDHFQWILEGDNTRLLRWLRRRYMPSATGSPTYPKIDPDCFISNIYPNFTNNFDIWDALFSTKINEINSLKNEWAQHILLDKRYKWLDAKDHEQVLWAWQNIQSGRYTKFKNQGIHRYDPLNTKEYYESVLSVFDCWLGHPAELKLSLEEMKKAWAQQKYRKGLKGKKQCTFVLKESTKKKLDQMATLKGLKLNEVVEYLVAKEHQLMLPKKA